MTGTEGKRQRTLIMLTSRRHVNASRPLVVLLLIFWVAACGALFVAAVAFAPYSIYGFQASASAARWVVGIGIVLGLVFWLWVYTSRRKE